MSGAPGTAGPGWAAANLGGVSQGLPGAVAMRLLATIVRDRDGRDRRRARGRRRARMPPTARAFARATERVLADPAFRAGPAARPGAEAGSRPGPSVDPREAALSQEPAAVPYGAPQLEPTALGNRSLGRRLRGCSTSRSGPIERAGERPVVGGFDLIGVVANSTPGPRSLVPDPPARPADRRQYLKRVRASGGRLMLDIQPGRSADPRRDRALSDWIAEPDVDVAIDPEWNVGPRGVPGKTTGSVTAKEINEASRRIERIVDDRSLPPKVLVVHQFSTPLDQAAGPEIKQRPGVQVASTSTASAGRGPKDAGYGALATSGLFNGFSLFYELDSR